jgi:hypothetical protein
MDTPAGTGVCIWTNLPQRDGKECSCAVILAFVIDSFQNLIFQDSSYISPVGFQRQKEYDLPGFLL